MMGRELQENVRLRTSFLADDDSKEPFLLQSENVQVKGVDVLEFDSHHFKAIACIAETTVRITPKGTILDKTPLESTVRTEPQRCFPLRFIFSDKSRSVNPQILLSIANLSRAPLPTARRVQSKRGAHFFPRVGFPIRPPRDRCLENPQ